jgi:hypothetical protein
MAITQATHFYNTYPRNLTNLQIQYELKRLGLYKKPEFKALTKTLSTQQKSAKNLDTVVYKTSQYLPQKSILGFLNSTTSTVKDDFFLIIDSLNDSIDYINDIYVLNDDHKLHNFLDDMKIELLKELNND